MTLQLEAAVEPNELVDVLRHYGGLTQRDIAQAAGVSDRTVYAWREGTAARTATYDRLAELREIVLILRDSLTPRGVGQWMRARNRSLTERRPLDVVLQDPAAVRAAAQAFAAGDYL